MMEANELRIGNTITHQNNNGIYLVTVLETLKKGINVKTNLQLGEWFLRYEEVQGTPLTEEWLLKFGFEDNGLEFSGCKIFEIGYIRVFHHKIRDSYSLGHAKMSPPSWVLGHTDYVHQLQNLWMGLTGKELVCI